MNVYSSADFVFNVPYEFTDRFAGQKDFFSSELKPGEMEDRAVNFIPDLTAVQLDYHPSGASALAAWAFIFPVTPWSATSWPSNPALTRKPIAMGQEHK